MSTLKKIWRKARYFIMFPLFFGLVFVAYTAWTEYQAGQEMASGMIEGEASGVEKSDLIVAVNGYLFDYEAPGALLNEMSPGDTRSFQVEVHEAGASDVEVFYTVFDITTAPGVLWEYESEYEAIHGEAHNMEAYMKVDALTSCVFSSVGAPLGCVNHVVTADALTIADIADVAFDGGALVGGSEEYMVFSVDYIFDILAENDMMGDEINHFIKINTDVPTP